MRSQSDSYEIIQRALNAANADEANALFVSTDQNITRFANSNVHQNMSEVSAELTLRVIVDNAIGIAATTVFDADEIARTAARGGQARRRAAELQRPLSRRRSRPRAAHLSPARGVHSPRREGAHAAH